MDADSRAIPRRLSTVSRSVSHSFSRASSSIGPAGSHPSSVASTKSRHAEPIGTTDVSIEPASLSMPPPSSRIIGRPSVSSSQQPSSFFDYRPSESSDVAVDDHAIDDNPRLLTGQLNQDGSFYYQLPDPTPTDDGRKRVSISSFLSVNSARGPISSAGSATGSDSSQVFPRSVSGIMTSAKGVGPPPSQSEASISNVTVTTSSNSNGHSPQPGGLQLTTRDVNSSSNQNPLDLVKRTMSTSNVAQAPRAQPTRSRSRAKRRFSGSTANSSHSPSSDRGPQTREKEEVKPAPLGIIGVCALDSKARSKPSRNILNRIIANREFDVVLFGDKTILDEGQ